MTAHTWGQQTTYGGKRVNWGLRYQIEAANKILASKAFGGEKGDLNIIQGSWSGSVSASAGTHSGTGALDITPYNWKNREKVFRLLGVAMWHRPALRNVWTEHMHGISDGDGGVSRGAANQVKQYHNRKNGLANMGADQGYRMLVFPLFVFPEKAAGKPGTCYVIKAGSVYEQPTIVSKVLGSVKKGDKFNVVAVVNVSGSYWGINQDGRCLAMSSVSRTAPKAAAKPTAIKPAA